jgi:hypothetical protein
MHSHGFSRRQLTLLQPCYLLATLADFGPFIQLLGKYVVRMRSVCQPIKWIAVGPALRLDAAPHILQVHFPATNSPRIIRSAAPVDVWRPRPGGRRRGRRELEDARDAKLGGDDDNDREEGGQAGRDDAGAHFDVRPDKERGEGVGDVVFGVVEEDPCSKGGCKDGTAGC